MVRESTLQNPLNPSASNDSETPIENARGSKE